MMRLLVSVRNAEEALAALEGGADLIDVKEPARGALGQASPAQVSEVAATVRDRVPLSMACGELAEWDSSAIIEPGLSFAKIGLAHCGQRNWGHDWRHWIASLPHGTQAVAVAYADWELAAAPSPAEVAALALAEPRCGGLLIDTYAKSGGTSLEMLDHAATLELGRAMQRSGRLWVMAGSLTAADVPTLIAWRPDYLAVRGAVCGSGRNSPVEAQRVRQLKAALCRSAPRALMPT